MHHVVATGPRQHLLAHLRLGTHPRPQDVLPTTLRLLQLRERLLADHPAVGHDADAADAEAGLQAFHDGHQRLDIRGVPRPQLATDGSALTIQHRSHHHLVQVGAMVLAVSPLSQGVTPLALEVNRGGVEEDQIQASEQLLAAVEQTLLDVVLHTAGGERRPSRLLVLGQFLSQPGHGPVQVVQLQGLTPLQHVVVAPLGGGAITARLEQAMHHRQEHGSFQREAEVALSEELLQDGLTAALAPQALEEQARTEGTGGEYGHTALGLSGQQHQGLGEACAGDEEGIELAAGLELVEPPEGSEDVLAGAAVFPAVFDQLQVAAWAGLLGAEEHGSLWIRDTWKLACFRVESRSISRWRGTMLLASAGSAPCRQRTCDDSARKSVEEKSNV